MRVEPRPQRGGGVSVGQLHLAVLGRTDIRHGDAGTVPLTSAKARALLCYLAITGETHSRSSLAGLLWGELPEERARANLRTALADLRRCVGGHLVITSRSVAFDRHRDHHLDRDDLLAAVEHGDPQHLQAAIARYRGDLLTDIEVAAAPGFDEWLVAEREDLRRTASAALRLLLADASIDVDASIRHARRLLELDPYDEAAHRALMRSLAGSGRRGAALAQFDTCRHVLAEELGIDPAPETVALRDALLRVPAAPSRAPSPTTGPVAATGPPAALGNADVASSSSVLPSEPPGSLPRPTGTFVGREVELARIRRLLASDHNAVVTLVGPGGVGKTRLAIAAAEQARTTFRDGVVFVPLAGVAAEASPSAAISSAVAGALRLDLSQRGAPHTQLARQLASHHVLLVLDNLDHLAVAAWLAELLQSAHGVSLLATSRRRLGIGAEWVLDIGGLPVPAGDEPEAALASPAVRLFLDRAARVSPALASKPGEAQLAAVARVCRLVDGMPLALELASEWTRSMSVEEVADRLGRDLDLLVTRRSDVPARHRSMRTVLDATWSMLSPDEQTVLARLAVFRGGFDAPAAQAVADAKLGTLADLVDRSVLLRPQQDRFDLHELLRRYATEHRPANEEAVAHRHAAYFAAIARQALLAPPEGAASFARIDRETANLRAAATWAIREGSEELVTDLVDGLWHLDSHRARFVEALELLEAAVARPALSPRLAGRWHHHAGTAAFELGRLERAVEAFDASLASAGRALPAARRTLVAATTVGLVREAARRVGPRRRPAPTPQLRTAAAETVEVLTMLTRTCYFLQQPRSMLLAALREAEAAERSGEAGALVTAYGELSHAATAAGRHRIARHYLRLADVVQPQVAPDDPRMLNLELKGLSHIAFAQWEAATAAVGAARATAAWLGYRHRWEELQITEGLVSLYQGRFAAARDQFVAGGRSARERGDPLTLTWALLGEADAAGHLGVTDGLVALLEEAVALSEELPAPERAKSWALLAWAALVEGDADRAVAAAVRAGMHYDTIRVLPVWYLDAVTRLAEVWLVLLARQPHTDPAVRRQARLSVARLTDFAQHYPVGVARAQWARGRLAWLEGHNRLAGTRWRASLRSARALGLAHDAARATFELTRLLPAGSPERADQLARARAAFAATGSRRDVAAADAALAGDG